MTDQTHAEQLAAFVHALGPEGHYSDLEPEGVARIRGADGEFYELRRETLRAVLADLDEDHVLEERAELTRALGEERGRHANTERLLAEATEKLAVATRTVAEVATQRDVHVGANSILRGLLSEFVDDEPCSYDQHGYCQTHGLSAHPCRNARAHQLIDAPRSPDEQQPAPHLVSVTHLPGGFDLIDRKPYERLIGNGVAGWVSHQVEHPAACHQLPYGQQCPFDDEWDNGQFTYDDIEPGHYEVHHAQQDVGDHHGEYSHTEDYLDYRRIGDAPERVAAVAATGYSDESPF